jgi:hypothetical protein
MEAFLLFQFSGIVWRVFILALYFLSFFAVMGIELRCSCISGMYSTTEQLLQPQLFNDLVDSINKFIWFWIFLCWENIIVSILFLIIDLLEFSVTSCLILVDHMCLEMISSRSSSLLKYEISKYIPLWASGFWWNLL